jgi:hypothetical protein
METFFKKFPYQTQIKKEPDRALFSLSSATAASIKAGVECVEILFVESVGGNAQRITNLTKSKSC